MQKYLYQDLYNLEETHWWHKSKRNLVSFFLKKYLLDKKTPLKRKERKKLLDAGCGAGKNIEAFSNIGTIWGLDRSSEAITFCKKRVSSEFQEGI